MGSQGQPVTLDEQTTSALVERLKVFIQCGGTITYGEFEELPEEVVAALARAAEEVDAERALILAEAVRSPDGALRVASALDGGDAHVRAHIARVVGEYVGKRGKGGAR